LADGHDGKFAVTDTMDAAQIRGALAGYLFELDPNGSAEPVKFLAQAGDEHDVGQTVFGHGLT
jgi:hypothetical protein